MKEEVRKLWNLCFGDNEEFTELYFSRRYNEDVNLAIQEEGKVISALQILPYPMTFCKEIIPTGYISGACTHPDYRSKGVMKRLLSKAFQRMQERDVPLSTLIPAEEWLFDYYWKMGYVPVFEYTENACFKKELIPSHKYIITEYTSADHHIFPYFEKKMKERPCCIQHTLEDFMVIVDDFNLGKGKILVASSGGEIEGMVFCYAEKETLFVSELFYENKLVKDTLLYTAAEEMNTEKIKIKSPAAYKKGEILGMARIINAEAMLQTFAFNYPDIKISFRLEDQQIELNNRIFSMNRGKIKVDNSKETPLQIDIRQLTQALLGYDIEQLPEEFREFPKQAPYMSLMLD